MSEFTEISGIGANMAEHLIRAGFQTIASLLGKSPDDIYTADCFSQGMSVDKCALYCYRLAVHYADHDEQLPEGKQNWWDWKD
ncbi:MAG: helix-hairpin-helix domain-containing protein [Clostridiales bacterium]|jgi:hypothetical protein|nr:helix-hairpin-helix domain-containing protein [Clostridiales bacterium]